MVGKWDNPKTNPQDLLAFLRTLLISGILQNLWDPENPPPEITIIPRMWYVKKDFSGIMIISFYL